MIDSIFFTLSLPLIFIIHNIEEYISFDKYPIPLIKRFNDRSVFKYALIILSMTVTTILALNYCYNSKILHFLTIIILFSIFINGIQHCALSLVLRKITPGTFSAAILILPFSVLVFYNEKMSLFNKIEDVLIYLFISMPIMYISIVFSLFCGLCIKKFIKIK
jgi:hypothetical protein